MSVWMMYRVYYTCVYRRYAEFVASIVTMQGSSVLMHSGSGGHSNGSSDHGGGSGGGISEAANSDSLGMCVPGVCEPCVFEPVRAVGIGGGGEFMLQHDLHQLHLALIRK